MRRLWMLNNCEINSIRRFNRRYVLALGVLNKKIFNTDLNWPQSRVLMEIGLNKKIKPIEISCNLNMDKSYTSRLIKQLIQKDLINKTPSNSDLRSVEITLTTLGKKVYKELNKQSNLRIRELIQKLSDKEQQEILNNVKKLDQLLFR